MQFLIKKSKQTITLLLFFIVFTGYQSKAQSITINNDTLLTSSIHCPNNPQCIYSNQNYFPTLTTIKNNSDQNLEIPIEIIKAHSSFLFKTIKARKIIGKTSPPALSDPKQESNLTLLPAHGEITIEGGYPKRFLKSAFRDADSNQVLLSETTSTKVYFQGSKEPIGYYQNGKFEPKIFILKAETTITKQ